MTRESITQPAGTPDDNPLAGVLQAMCEADGLVYTPTDPPPPAQRQAWQRVAEHQRAAADPSAHHTDGVTQ